MMRTPYGPAVYTEAESALIRDIRILLDEHQCELVVEIDKVSEPASRWFHDHHTAIITGPGIAILIDADLARAVAGEDGPPPPSYQPS